MPRYGMPRSQFGKWIEEHGLSETQIASESGVSDSTISDLAIGKTKKPTMRVRRKLLEAMRRYDSEVSGEDFWC